RVCGDHFFARHSIDYTGFRSYFHGFSIWDEHHCALGWDETITWFELLGVIPVPVIWRGVFNEAVLKKLAREIDTSSTEGFVVRLTSAFDYSKFSTSAAKWVRAQHVTSTTHWAHSVIVPNTLQKCNNVEN
ncbi:MAG: RNA ligase family protein, partial [Prevotella sp.]